MYTCTHSSWLTIVPSNKLHNVLSPSSHAEDMFSHLESGYKENNHTGDGTRLGYKIDGKAAKLVELAKHTIRIKWWHLSKLMTQIRKTNEQNLNNMSWRRYRNAGLHACKRNGQENTAVSLNPRRNEHAAYS